MIEKVVLDYLTTKLTPTPVYVEIPKDTPVKFVLIQKTGSSRSNLLESATIAVQSYDSSLYNASVLNEAVKEAMYELPSVKEVSKCDLNSDYEYTDTVSKRYRYQAVFDIVHY